MRILGIETSCDETAVCLIEGDGAFGPDFTFEVLGNALSSQAALHAHYGGVFPNLAKREHIKNLPHMLAEALTEAGKKSPGRTAIDAIAVSVGPGLEPCLWTGITFTQELAAKWNVPVVAVNHMEGHIALSMMGFKTERPANPNTSHFREVLGLEKFDFPVLALLISGGHTELALSKEFGRYELIGQTRDDAAGEAFDKVARLLDLPYPGGPEISRLALEARSSKLEADFKLPRPMLHEDNFDFSFSGLKTAVRRIVEARQLSDEQKQRLAREFEDAVADVLVAKTMRAVDEFSANTIVVGGGVSANTYIRERLASACQLPTVNCELLVPPPELATDNAIMIALAGYFHALNKDFTEPATLAANGNLALDATKR